MTIAERNNKLKHFITCLKCEVSGKCCDDNCSTQYDAGNMGEIIENLEAISKELEQEPAEKKHSKTCGTCRFFRGHQDKKDIERCKELFGENTLCGYCTYWEDTHEVALPTIEYDYCSHYEEVEP